METSPDDTTTTGVHARTPRLLLVDDEPGIREGLAALLRRKGHEVRTAADCAAETPAFRKISSVSAVSAAMLSTVLSDMRTAFLVLSH